MSDLNLQLALAAGLCSPGWWEIKPAPIGYRYNSVLLPKITESMMTKYDRLCKVTILDNYTYTRSPTYGSDPVTTIYNGDYIVMVDLSTEFIYSNGEFIRSSIPYCIHSLDRDSFNWLSGYELPPAYNKSITASSILWANYDILDENGDVYIPTTTPIPVFE